MNNFKNLSAQDLKLGRIYVLKKLVNKFTKFGTNANGSSGEKSPSKDLEKNFFQLSNLSQSIVVRENPTNWGLETPMCPIYAKPVLHIFAVCSLVPGINLPHTQQFYLCQKGQNYLLGKADLRFFLS